MSERKTVETEEVRRVIRSLADGGKEVTYQLIYECMGLENESEKDVVRARVSAMVKHGEIIRTERGAFTYNFKRAFRKSAGYDAIWRFVRAAKPGWSIEDCSLMTRISYTHALRYINWLEEEGYIIRVGRNSKNAITFANTSKARQSPETPYPAIRETDPFAKERVAAAHITRLMLCANPYSPKTARLISEACHTLLARFEKTEADSRMENENKENCDVE